MKPCEVCGTQWHLPFEEQRPEEVNFEGLCPSCWFNRYEAQCKAREDFGAAEVRKIESAIYNDGPLKWLIFGAVLIRLAGFFTARWFVYLTLFSACIDLYFLFAQFRLRKVVPLMLFSEITRMQMARVLFSIYAAFDWRVGLAFAGLEIFGMLISFTVSMHDKDVR